MSVSIGLADVNFGKMEIYVIFSKACLSLCISGLGSYKFPNDSRIVHMANGIALYAMNDAGNSIVNSASNGKDACVATHNNVNYCSPPNLFSYIRNIRYLKATRLIRRAAYMATRRMAILHSRLICICMYSFISHSYEKT